MGRSRAELVRLAIDRYGSLADAWAKARARLGYTELFRQTDFTIAFAGLYHRPEDVAQAERSQDLQWELLEAALFPEDAARERPKGAPGHPGIRITPETLSAILERGLERARSSKKRRRPTYDEIAAEFGLKRTWVTPIVKWAETHQREARRAIATSETPKRFSALVREKRR